MKLIAGKGIPTFCWQKPSTNPEMGLLIAVLLRGGGAYKERHQIVVYGTIYQYFRPIRLDAQMIAFITGMSFVMLGFSSWCCI